MKTHSERPVILISNDDGVTAEGIRSLARALADLGEVWIVGPATDQSAISHAMTLGRPLRMQQHEPLLTNGVSIPVYSVDGTPTDCIYMAAHHLLKNRKIALVVSGINHGANLGIDVLYSGTVSAAMEGLFLGIPSVALSLVASSGFDFGPASAFARALCQSLLGSPPPPNMLLNVNIPKYIRQPGFAVTHLGSHDYALDVSERVDPRGKPYYWIGGEWRGFENIAGTDCRAIADGYISVTPLQIDLTNRSQLGWLKDLPVQNYPVDAAYQTYDPGSK